MTLIFKSPSNENFFFGYYGKSQLDKKNEKLLALKTKFFNRIPEKGDSVDIGYFEINSKKIPVENFANALEEILTISERSFTKSRYKGLGEMNADQLWDTTMNPDMRILGQVSIEDAQAADDLFHALMGDEVEPRRDFIDENAKLVVNLDV